MLARKDQLIFYNSIHSYSQLVLLPWGFTNEAPEDYQQMYDTAMLGSDALTAVHGKEYEVSFTVIVTSKAGLQGQCSDQRLFIKKIFTLRCSTIVLYKT